MIGTAIGIFSLLILLFALYAVSQWHKTHRRNRILARQITEAVEYKEKYKELKRSVEAESMGIDTGSGVGKGKFEIRPQGDRDLKSPIHNSRNIDSSAHVPLTANPTELSDVDLFAYLRDLIEHEELYLNPRFERQMLINRTGLSKERIGAAFAQGSGHERLTTLVRELRLDYAVRLMNEQPDFTIEQVCQASGFANADTFTRNFKAKYGMTPSTYRETKG